MKYFLATLILPILLFSCNSGESKLENLNSDFEKSFKEQQNNSFKEHIDSISNIYSNFKYNVAYDGPNNWKFDSGVSEHTIYRTFQADSAITFSINVIEIKNKIIKKKKQLSIWDIYESDKKQMDEPLVKLIEEQLKTKVMGYKVSKAYLKNNVAVRRSFNYVIRNLDQEYKNTTVQYQVQIDNFTITLNLDVPDMFYEQKPNYYEELFNNFHFLKKGDRLNELIKNQE